MPIEEAIAQAQFSIKGASEIVKEVFTLSYFFCFLGANLKN